MKKTVSKPSNHVKRFLTKCGSLLSTNAFFVVILTVFVIQALWIAWSGAFSMAYDEYYHLGIIQEYAKGWLPFIQQPPGPAELGAVTRDASFLYHYLMSFPWRIVTAIWHGFASQMIVMRIFNVAIFTTGLYLYWRVLVSAGLSKRLSNVVMLFFTLIPTVVMLAAQLNYDNLTFLMSGLALLMATNILKDLQDKKTLQITKLVLLVAVLLTGSIVKYAFLPLGVAIGLFMLFQIGWESKKGNLSWKKIWLATKRDAQKPIVIFVIAVFVIASFLFVERIGLNVIRYKTPAPDCAKVLPVEQCAAHDPYGRNLSYMERNFAQYLTVEKKLKYPFLWYDKMVRESFFVVGSREIGYSTGAPLPFGKIAGVGISLGMIIIITLRFSWIWRQNSIYRLFIVVSLAYVATLFATNFSEYLRLGIPVAIHGRYLIYVVPLLGMLTIVALRKIIGKVVRPFVVALATVAVLSLLLGGGWLPWVIRSADNWMWPHAVPATRVLRSALWYVVPK